MPDVSRVDHSHTTFIRIKMLTLDGEPGEKGSHFHAMGCIAVARHARHSPWVRTISFFASRGWQDFTNTNKISLSH